MKLKLTLISLLFATGIAAADSPIIISPTTGQYLGNLNSNRYDVNSVANPYGEYGSKYGVNSINNSFGTYGSRYSPHSATNPYATGGTAPIMLIE